MPILPNAPASEVHVIELVRWTAIRTDCEELHFVGFSVALGHARVSSPIVTFHQVARTGVTHTGRLYTRVGEPGLDGDGLYILRQWLAGYRVPEWRDVTATFALGAQ